MLLAGLFALEGRAAAGATQLALDLDVAGNGPRTVAEIDGCRSLAVGESVDIDLVLPSPGVPAASGLSAYQFSLFYDPELVWVTADSPEMLMDQAPGSQIIPLSDPKPDRNGVYISWAVDFGPTAVEPAGASEKGPGVLSRLTITAQAAGSTELQVFDVQLIDADSDQMAVSDVTPATLSVGQPCAGQSDGQGASATPAPQATGPTTAPDPTPGPPDPPGEVASSAPIGGSLPVGGGPPGRQGDSWGLLFAGLAVFVSGGALFAAVLYTRASPRE